MQKDALYTKYLLLLIWMKDSQLVLDRSLSLRHDCHGRMCDSVPRWEYMRIWYSSFKKEIFELLSLYISIHFLHKLHGRKVIRVSEMSWEVYAARRESQRWGYAQQHSTPISNQENPSLIYVPLFPSCPRLPIPISKSILQRRRMKKKRSYSEAKDGLPAS